MSESEDIDWDEISYVISSEYRLLTVKSLLKRPMTPTRIADVQDISSMAHISRALQELTDRGITELKVSEERRKGRIYGLTEEGFEIAEESIEHK